MYENIIGQEVTERLKSDIALGTFPNSVLLSGPEGSGKLTVALETARVLSCQKDGGWQCTCPSCVRAKALVSTSLMLMGSRDSSLEIAAARSAFLDAVVNETSYIDGTRHFFLRAVRKLTMRFNPILWEGDTDLSKASALTSQIDELMATIDYPQRLGDADDVQKTVDKITEHCQKLETTLLYDTIPVLHVRNVSSWARLKTDGGKRVIIIEGADKMLDSVRNSLLKILEEPPADTVFILTTAHRAAVMSTILSRVRTYSLHSRGEKDEREVLERVFHANAAADMTPGMTIKGYLDTFLPVKPDIVRAEARNYIDCVTHGRFPDASAIVKSCASFKPRALLTVFVEEVAKCLGQSLVSAVSTEGAAQAFDALRDTASAIGTYNINAAAALENLFVTLSRINASHEGALWGGQYQ